MDKDTNQRIQTKLASPFECCIWEIFASITSLKTYLKQFSLNFS